MSEDKALFAQYMKSIRESARLTIEEAALRINVEPKCIMEWEGGSQTPPHTMLEVISATYKVRLIELTEIVELESSRRGHKPSSLPK